MIAPFNRWIVKPIKYCFVDFDGTVRELGGVMSPTSLEQVKVYPWASQRLQEARAKGYCIIGITNQKRATALIGESGVKNMCDETLRQLHMDFPYYFAKTDAESKPNPYMIEQAQAKYGKADLQNSIMIGDDIEKDGGIAKNCGIKFITTEDFQKNGVP